MQQSVSYTPETLAAAISASNMKVISMRTSFVKILPHAGMQDLLDSQIFKRGDLETMYRISSALEGLGSEIFLIAEKA